MMKKWLKTLIFLEENNICLLNFDVFNENEFLQKSNYLDDNEISLFIEQNRNVNTTKETKTSLNVWKRWCESLKETEVVKEIPAKELNNLLCHFFVKVRKLHGLCLQQLHYCCPPLPDPKRRRLIIDFDEDG